MGRVLDSGQYLLEDIKSVVSDSSAVGTLVSDNSLTEELREALTYRANELEPVLRCFVPKLVEERLDAGQRGVFVHEHRKLVSVFMKASPCERLRWVWGGYEFSNSGRWLVRARGVLSVGWLRYYFDVNALCISA